MNCKAFVHGCLAPLLKGAVNEKGFDGQASRGGCAADVVEHDVKRAQRLACPVARDLTEETILNGIILGGAGRIMADHNRDAESVNELALQRKFPEPGAAVVAATRITEEQELVLSLKAGMLWVGPPLCDGMGGKFWCIIGVAQIDIILVMDDVIDAIGYGPTQRIAREIMDIDLLRSLTPTTTLIGEVADQLLVLGIDTNDRIACVQELLSHTTNVAKLSVAVGMNSASQALAVGNQAKAQLSQEPTDCGATDAVCPCAQPRCNGAQAQSHPFLFICRQTRNVVVDDFLDAVF